MNTKYINKYKSFLEKNFENETIFVVTQKKKIIFILFIKAY